MRTLPTQVVRKSLPQFPCLARMPLLAAYLQISRVIQPTSHARTSPLEALACSFSSLDYLVETLVALRWKGRVGRGGTVSIALYSGRSVWLYSGDTDIHGANINSDEPCLTF